MQSTIYRETAEHFAGSSIPFSLHATRTDPTSNEIATRDTIAHMRMLALRSAKHPLVQGAVVQAIANVPSESNAREFVVAIYDWMQAKIEFKDGDELMRELWGVHPGEAQLQITPLRLLTMDRPKGACNDQSALLAAMLLNVPDIGVEFVTVGADPDNPERWSHVYVEAILLDGERMPLDVSHGPYAGWEEGRVSKRKVWKVREVRNMIAPLESCYGCGMKGLGAWPIADWISQGIEATTNILTSKYGVPPAGTVITTQGGQVIRYPTGTATVGLSTFPSDLSLGSGGSDLIKWGLIAAVVIVGAKALSEGK